MKFALGETNRSAPAVAVALEVALATGERLRIAPGVDAATLSMALSELRDDPSASERVAASH